MLFPEATKTFYKPLGDIMKKLNHIIKTLSLVSVLIAAGCSSGGDNNNGTTPVTPSPTTTVPTAVVPASLNQAAYVSGTSRYEYGHNSISNIPLSGAPLDTDYSRWAMLHDGSSYRLYFFKQGTSDTLYQFAYNAATQTYQYGFNSIDQLTISGIPADADTASISMLHDGSTYRLYMKSLSNPATLYQFAYNTSTQQYIYGYNSIDVLFISMAPADADYSRWAMLHDGSNYRLYIGKAGSVDTMYQFAYNSASADYEYGYNSIGVLSVTGMPAGSIKTDFAMLHDGSNYRFYYGSEL